MFNRNEAAKFLESESLQPFSSFMEKLFFSISYYTGLEVDVVQNLKWKNLSQRENVIRTEDKEKIYNSSLNEPLTGLRKSSGFIGDEDFIFTDIHGDKLSRDFIQASFVRAMETAGVDYQKRKLTPNSFRRTFNFWFA